MGTLHKSLVRAEAAALSPQCREASGLSADSLARAESLDKVLQQVSGGPRGAAWVAELRARPGRCGVVVEGSQAWRGQDKVLFETFEQLPHERVLDHSQKHLTFQPLQIHFRGSTPEGPPSPQPAEKRGPHAS